ncbi:MAG: DUF3168 domain-containing protein [Alphaproteobacteria bacterium]|nr:DUF3168 domain-containing protein [Alphaproteobacteria bacterium]
MSADSLWDVQTGVYALLTTTAALTAQLAAGAGSVLDHVPEGAPFPYVVLGAASSVPSDTQGFSGSEATLTIDTYSRGAGMEETRRIMSAIYDALHAAAFSVPNQTLVQCRCVESATSVEADGLRRYEQNALVRHGVQKFRVITEPV